MRQVRVVAVLVERDYAHGELFHHPFFLATNAARHQGGSDAILTRYRGRGEAEQHIGEFLTDIAPTVSSARDPWPNVGYFGTKPTGYLTSRRCSGIMQRS